MKLQLAELLESVRVSIAKLILVRNDKWFVFSRDELLSLEKSIEQGEKSIHIIKRMMMRI